MRPILFVALLVSLMSSFGRAETFDELFVELDDLIDRQVSDYDEVFAKAKYLRRAGVEKNNREIEARALVRLAFSNIVYGKWDPEWVQWRDRATQLSERLPRPNIARAELLVHMGFIRH